MDLLNLFRLQWDRAIAIIAAVVGLVALLLGYIGTSGTPHVALQLPYFISGGLFGIFCLTIAAIAWISADLRDEWRELHGIRELLAEELKSRAVGQSPAMSRAVTAEVPVAYPSTVANGVAARNETPKRRTRKVSTAAVEQ